MTTAPDTRPAPARPHDDDSARVAELRRFDLSDTATGSDFEALTRLAAYLCQTPVAAVSLVSADRQWFLPTPGLAAGETPRALSFCAHAIEHDGVFEIQDATRDARFAGTPLVAGDAHVVFYAGTPLVTTAGQALGTLCVIDHVPRALTTDQRDALTLLGRQVVRSMEQQCALTTVQALRSERLTHLEQLERHASTLARSEQRLAMVLAAEDAGYWDWDLPTGAVTCNCRCAELLRIDGDGPWPVEAVFAALDDPHLEALHAAFADLFSRRTAHLHQEFQVHPPGREPRWLRFRGHVASWGPDGEPLRALGLALDITHDRQRDELVRTTQKLDALGALTAGVAHEISTPLQFVSHNLDFLAAHYATVAAELSPDVAAAGTAAFVRHDDLASAIAESIDGLDRVAHIVQALKVFSHQGRGGRESVDINQMIEHAVTVTRHEWKSVAIVDRDLAPGLPPVAAAGYECGQVFVNLLVNAAHAVQAAAGTDGRGRITVRTQLVDGHVEIRVADTGTGIAPEIRDRIFEPFFTTKRLGKGTGQGLPTARAIVERYGGSLSFESEVGHGTTFVVRFPAARDARQAA